MTVPVIGCRQGGVVIEQHDVTWPEWTTAPIEETEDCFTAIADALPVVIWISDEEGRRTYFNDAWTTFTGQRVDTALDSGWNQSLHPADRTRYLAIYKDALASAEPFSIEYRLRSAQGTYGWFVDRGVPRHANDGRFLGLVGGCLNISERREMEDALRDLSGRLITAQEDANRRVARELHDGLHQLIGLLAIEIQQLELAPPSAPGAVSLRLRELWNRTADLSAEVHRISHQLHPAPLDALGLVPALEGYCAELTEQQALSVTFTHRNVPASLHPDIALGVFRIVQEALQNAVKHGGAREASVQVRGTADALFLRIRDAGCGFEETAVLKRAGLGLVSMRERVGSAGGQLKIASKPGEGTRISVRLPLEAPAPVSPVAESAAVAASIGV